MPSIEFFLLLFFIGAATGSVASVIKIAPALIAIPALYFFLPVFDLSFQILMLPVIATCIAAFVPTHLYAWILSMKLAKVDSQQLIHFAPGVAMGGVIGAQLLSFSGVLIFKVFFLVLSLVAIKTIVFTKELEKNPANKFVTPWKLPIGLVLGIISLLGGNCGRVVAELLCRKVGVIKTQQQGTVEGLVVFTSIAAVIGFIYPAQSFDNMGEAGFAGAVHLPSMIILAISHFLFFHLCRNRGNELDRRVLKISFAIFLLLSVGRFWLS